VLPDPSGVYVGQATFTLQDSAGTFTQNWRVDLTSQPCPDCDPGQYYFTSTNFSGLSYQDGTIDRGGVYGSVGPSGRAFDLQFYSVNCDFLNPSGSLVAGAEYSGSLWGGNFGAVPGSPLMIRNGSVSGRVSGRNCAGRLVTADVSLQRQPGAAVLSCPTDFSGVYSGSYSNSCGDVASGDLVVYQSNCYFSAVSTGYYVRIDGAIATGSRTFSFSAHDSRCPGDVFTGTGGVDSRGVVTGSYSGASTCCPGKSTISGSFTGSPR
jgi:hypothetical protein